MRFFLVSIWLLGPSASAFSAYPQQLVPIVREIRTSSAPSVTEWKTFVQMPNFGGVHYVSLVQVAELLNGHMRWHPVGKRVELSLHNQTIRFSYRTPEAWINGQRVRLEKAPVKNDDGFWIPVSFFASKAFFRATRMKMEWPPKPDVKRKTGPMLSSPVVSGRGSIKIDSPPVAAGNDGRKTVTAGNGRHTVAAAQNYRAVRRIVIDPGHGGKDPGTIGGAGTEEKAINLELAKELADLLRERYRYEVVMTRTDDTFIPLERRARLANEQNADLFVSIHCNASLSSKLKGFEVYFLSERASDPHADAVARLENAPLALEGKQVPTPNEVAVVLRSLVKTAIINDASALGMWVDRHLGKRLSEPSLGVKQAGFYVLRGAEMPAILVESGFLSNPKEERLLRKPSFRRKLVEGVAAGIAAYDQSKQKERT